MRAIAIASVALAVFGCGGGGGGGASSTPNTDTAGAGTGSAGALSDTQATFEDAALASNGGYFVAEAFLQFSGGAVYLSQLALPSISMPQSPRATGGPVQSTYTVSAALAPHLEPAFRDESDPNVGTAFIENGQIQFYSNKTAPVFKYEGANVISTTSPGSGVGGSVVAITSNVKVPLAGKFVDAPADFRGLFGSTTSWIIAAVTFDPGSAYYQQVRVRVGDFLLLSDADGNPATDPMSATPVAASTTLDAFSQAHLSNPGAGAIRTVKGARCWVATAPSDLASSPSYDTYCELGGNVYHGNLEPDGAQMGGYSYATGSLVKTPYQIRLNKAAADSIKRMIAGS
jgi:hypothetical protein